MDTAIIKKRKYIHKDKHLCEYIYQLPPKKGQICGKSCRKTYEIDNIPQYRCGFHNPIKMQKDSEYRKKSYHQSDLLLRPHD